MVKEEAREPCPFCGGSGQLNSFKGVSRFLLTVEECPQCAGLGYILPAADSPVAAPADGKRRQ
jgi:DnaJ-class molecular chaperone